MRVVVVHRGARDGYQVALALAEENRLERLVTDLYWPADRPAVAAMASRMPAGLQQLLRQRHVPALSSGRVRQLAARGALSLVLEKVRQAPFAWRRATTRWTDAQLGADAGRLATRRGAALLAYSYYGHSAFAAYDGPAPRMLFQLHPHPASMRRILLQERQDHPECASSLEKEWELSLPEQDYQRLVDEVGMAESWLAASSFTKQTLVENGVPARRIHVVPYGVDLERFQPDTGLRALNGPLKLLFVGTINQRKGIKYLVDAVKRFPARDVELTICGRVVDDLAVLRPLGDQVRVRPSVSSAELQAAYRAADLFAFPSVAEGFAHVLLEALASGLPILSTPRTAAPDLIDDGRAGFVVAPRDADALAERIAWAVTHRAQLARLRAEARATAERFTWARFRSGVAAAVTGCLEQEPVREVARV